MAYSSKIREGGGETIWPLTCDEAMATVVPETDGDFSAKPASCSAVGGFFLRTVIGIAKTPMGLESDSNLKPNERVVV